MTSEALRKEPVGIYLFLSIIPSRKVPGSFKNLYDIKDFKQNQVTKAMKVAMMASQRSKAVLSSMLCLKEDAGKRDKAHSSVGKLLLVCTSYTFGLFTNHFCYKHRCFLGGGIFNSKVPRLSGIDGQ